MTISEFVRELEQLGAAGSGRRENPPQPPFIKGGREEGIKGGRRGDFAAGIKARILGRVLASYTRYLIATIILAAAAFATISATAQPALELQRGITQRSITLAQVSVAGSFATTTSGLRLRITGATVLEGFQKPLRGYEALQAMQPGMELRILKARPDGEGALRVREMGIVVR